MKTKQTTTESVGKLLDKALQRPTIAVSYESLEAIVEIAHSRGVSFLTKEESEKYETLIPRWKNCHVAVYDNTPIRAKERWLENEKQIADGLASGKPLSEETNGWTRIDFEECGASRMASAKLGGNQVVREAVTIARPAFARFAKFCEELASELELKEMDVCESLRLDYRPSCAVATIRSAPATADHRCPNIEFCSWGQDPTHFLGWLQPKTLSK